MDNRPVDCHVTLSSIAGRRVWILRPLVLQQRRPIPVAIGPICRLSAALCIVAKRRMIGL